MARRRRRSSWVQQQAAMEALVRYGPEISGLRELQAQAESNYRTAVQQARGGARAIRQGVRQARPQFNAIYDRAGEAQTRAAQVYEGNVEGLAPAADPIKAAIAGEQRLLSGQIAQSRAADMSMLRQRSLGAREGRVLGERQALQTRADELGKILQRRQDLRGEQGAFMAATLGELMEERRGRRQQLRLERMAQRGQTRRTRITQRGQNRRAVQEQRQSERNSLRSAGIDPDTGRPIPGGRLDPRAPQNRQRQPRATPGQVGAAADAYGEAFTWARQLRDRGRPREDVMRVLALGVEEAPVKDPQTGRPVLNPDGTPRVRPGIPKIKSALLLTAAVEVAYQGFVSNATAKMLRRRGLRLSDLGVATRRNSGASGYSKGAGRPD